MKEEKIFEFEEILQQISNKTLQEVKINGFELNDADVERLAKLLPQSKVISLNLYRNEISEAGVAALAKGLLHSQVTSLNLEGSKMGDAGVASLAAVLPQSQVTSINLESNKIGDEGVASLAAVLPRSKVTGLNLACNKIEDAGVASLSMVLSQSKVTNMNLCQNKIGETGAIALAAALPQSKVTIFDLGNNEIGKAGVTSLAAMLPQSQVTSFNLEHNEIGNVGAAALAKVLPQSKITSLDLRGNKIGEAGAAALSKVLPHSQVASLNLGSNKIGEAGVASLVAVLPQSQITSLDLSFNKIGEAGAAVLAKGLPHSQVASLVVRDNKIGGAGAAALAKVLPQSKVTNLDLWNNEIGDAGATALAKVLPQSKVTNLDLGGNLMGNEVGSAEATALAMVLLQSQVTNLDLGGNLSGNEIGEIGAVALAKALPQSKIANLDLFGNEVGEAGATALFTSLKKNYVITEINGVKFNKEQKTIATSHFEVNKLLNAKVDADNDNVELVHELVSTALRHINQPQLLDDPIFEKPKRLLLRAAELGSVQALYHLGNLYLNELKDLNLAKQYYLQAANNGHDISKLCLELLSKKEVASNNTLQLSALNINLPRRFSLNTKDQMLETRDAVIANLKEANLLISKTGISLHALAQLAEIKASASVFIALKDYEPAEPEYLHFSAGQVLYIPYGGDIMQGFQVDALLLYTALWACFIPYNKDKQGNKRADVGMIVPDILLSDYLQQKPREDWTAEEVCNAIIIPQTKASKEGEVGKAYIDTLPEACRGKPFEGYIFSYARSTKFSNILQTLNERFKEQDPNQIFIWIDIAGVNQHAWFKMKSDEIGKILEENLTQLFTHISGGRLIHFDKASPTNLTRSWCLVELLACLKAQQHTVAQTEICMTADVQAEVLAQDTMEMLNSVDSSKAQCFNEQDRIAINAQIKRDLISDGETDIAMEEAYERLNNVVKSWLVTKFLPDFSNIKALEQEAAVAQQYSSEQRPKQITFGYDRSKARSLGNSKATEQTRDESRNKQKNQCVIG